MAGKKGKFGGGGAANILQLYSGVDNKPVDADKDKKDDKKKMIKKRIDHKEELELS